MVSKTLLSLLTVALMLSGTPRLSADDKPVAVCTIASCESFQKDLKFVGEFAGIPDLDKSIDGIVALMTQGKGLKGLDKTRPLGAAIFFGGTIAARVRLLADHQLEGLPLAVSTTRHSRIRWDDGNPGTRRPIGLRSAKGQMGLREQRQGRSQIGPRRSRISCWAA